MPIRLIAVDIDGTLLDTAWQLPDANVKAVAEAVARGIEVALVTGRRFDFALPIAEQIPCPLTMILNNGALVKTKDRVTHIRNLLPRETALKVLRATPAYRDGVAIMFDRPRERQVIFERLDFTDPQRRGYLERNREFIAEVSPIEDCLTEDPIQVMFTGGFEPMRALAGELHGLSFAGEFSMALTEYEARNFSLVDVVRPGCSKGATLADWARHRGLTREQVMAIGDNLNDREMLEFAGTPVVMGNAVPGLKNNGWAVTGTNDEGGVAAAIEKFALSAA